MKTTSSAPSVGTGEKRKRMGSTEKDLCCYHTIERQLQCFLCFDLFAKSELLWVGVAGVLLSLPNLAVLPESHSPPCRDWGLFEAVWRAPGRGAELERSNLNLLQGQVTISSKENTGPWWHPFKWNGFNAVPSDVSMALRCLKVKCFISTNSKRQATFPKHRPGHLRHAHGTASCDTGPARDPRHVEKQLNSRQYP